MKIKNSKNSKFKEIDQKHILFLCTGNSCRSAMAEGYFSHLLRQNAIRNWACASAGIAADTGMPAAQAASETLAKLDISLENHSSRQITSEFVAKAEHIFCMDQSNLDYVKSTFPEMAEESSLLLDLVPAQGGGELDDPNGLDSEAYEQCFLTMMPALTELISRVARIK